MQKSYYIIFLENPKQSKHSHCGIVCHHQATFIFVHHRQNVTTIRHQATVLLDQTFRKFHLTETYAATAIVNDRQLTA